MEVSPEKNIYVSPRNIYYYFHHYFLYLDFFLSQVVTFSSVANFQHPRTTPYVGKVTAGEEEKEITVAHKLLPLAQALRSDQFYYLFWILTLGLWQLIKWTLWEWFSLPHDKVWKSIRFTYFTNKILLQKIYHRLAYW